VLLALAVGVALAQEGYPLKGSWLGDYGVNRTSPRTQVFVTMDWVPQSNGGGYGIIGTINPGTDNIPIKNASLTPPTPPPPGAGGGRGGGGAGGGRGGARGGRGGAGGDAAAGAPPAAAPPPPPPPAATVPAVPAQPDWLVHFEADGKDSKGAAVHYVVDGKIESIGLANRSIVGTWTAGTTKNDFRITRQ